MYALFTVKTSRTHIYIILLFGEKFYWIVIPFWDLTFQEKYDSDRNTFQIWGKINWDRKGIDNLEKVC